MFNFILRQNNEDIIKLKGLSSDGKIPKGLIMDGSVAVKDGKIK